MADIFRIIDRFNIEGRGMIYTINKSKDASIQIGDILSDLRNNKFKVREIEITNRLLEGVNLEDIPIGLLLDSLCGVEVEGNILGKDLKCINFLFCNHPLYPSRVDEDYEEEYQEAGLDHLCALFSYEDMECGKLSLYGEDIEGLTIYRGWMMKPKMYKVFYSLLETRGIILINTPDEYERYHLLPRWYDDFRDETVETIWESQENVENVLLLAKQLEGSYIVKDFVKSRKHEWYDACFIQDISDIRNTAKIIKTFIDRQGDSLVGGVVLRKFVELKQIGFHEKSGMPISEEYRVFIYAGKILAIDNYWTKKQEVDISKEECRWIASIADRVQSNFVTVDVARKKDGKLIVMEFGDGQVSGLQEFKAEEFYRLF